MLTMDRLAAVWDQFVMEMVIVCVLLIYLAVYVWGGAVLRDLTRACLAAQETVLSQHFAVVGDGATGGHGDLANTCVAIQDPCSMVAYASGRDNCQALILQCRLNPVHDVVMGWLGNLLIGSSHHTLTAHIPLFAGRGHRATIDAYVLAVKTKLGYADYKKSRFDLEKLCWPVVGETKFSALQRLLAYPSTLVVVADQAGSCMVDTVLNQTVTDGLMFLASHSILLSEILVTDQPAVEPETVSSANEEAQKYLKMEWKLETRDAQQMQWMTERALEFTLFFLDHITSPSCQLSMDVRLKSIKQRRDIVEKIEKKLLKRQQEELQKRKAEKAKQQQVEIDQLPRAMRKKIEDKMAKKDMKDLKKRMSSKVKVMK